MKFVSLKKAIKDVNTETLDKLPKIEKAIDTPRDNYRENEENKQIIEQKRDNYGKLSITLLIFAMGSLLSSAFSVGTLFFLMVLVSTKKVEESSRILGQIIQDEASQRIGEILKVSLHKEVVKFYSASEDERLKVDKNILDYFLTLRGGVSFAVSVRTVVPPVDKKSRSRVYLDPKKKLLSYRKGDTSKRYFHYDPIENIREATNYLCQYHRDVFEHLPTRIVVMGEPIIIKIELTSSFVRILDGQRYLYVNGVYVVEERRLVNLILSIYQKKLDQGR